MCSKARITKISNTKKKKIDELWIILHGGMKDSCFLLWVIWQRLFILYEGGMCRGICVGNWRTGCWNLFSPSTMWIPRTKLRSSNLESGTAVHGIISLAGLLLWNLTENNNNLHTAISLVKTCKQATQFKTTKEKCNNIFLDRFSLHRLVGLKHSAVFLPQPPEPDEFKPQVSLTCMIWR